MTLEGLTPMMTCRVRRLPRLLLPPALLAALAAAPSPARAGESEPPAPQASPTPAPSPSPSTIDTLIHPKLAGGQFSGAEGLYRGDRVKIGGYMDFRYQTRGIDDGFEIRESADQEHPDETDVTNFRRNGFIAPRLLHPTKFAPCPSQTCPSPIAPHPNPCHPNSPKPAH